MVTRFFLLLVFLPFSSQFLQAQIPIIQELTLFPDTSYVSAFTADAHTHRMSAENFIFTKNVRATMGGMFPLLSVDLFGVTSIAGIGASVHFELHPMGQGQIVSNEYYVDYIMLDVPVSNRGIVRFVTGHTSHHLSDNWFEHLQYTRAVRFSRDYVKLFFISQDSEHQQWYAGCDYAYIMTVGQRISKPWIFQAGGKLPLAEYWELLTLYAAADVKIRQESAFASAQTLHFGVAVPMQHAMVLRFFLQYRWGLDERGQFFPQHRTMTTVGFSIE